MKRVLISTVYNEAASIAQWVEALKAQTVQPDEFVIVDGGSKDDTVELIRKGFATGNFPQPVLIVQRCNIAEGRNIAIRNSTSPVIASMDAGSVPDRRWLEEVTTPFEEHPGIGVVGGECPMTVQTDIQRAVDRLQEAERGMWLAGGDCKPSSRNVAFTREAWAAVGGYPEWLTLTAEDALFNVNLHAAGVRFYYQPSAIVAWDMRPDFGSYLRMMRSYGFGSGEMNQGPKMYRRWLLTTLFPPLILFSRHPISYAPLRYLRNAASTLGWIEGVLKGRKPPQDWRCVNGDWLSPQTLTTIRDRNQP